MLIVYAVMTVVAAALAAWTGCPSLFRLPPEPWLLWASLGAAAALAAVVVRGGKALESVGWYRRMAIALKRIVIEALGPRIDSQRALVIAVYSSVGEEAFFRGFLQPWFIAKLGGPESLAATALGVVAASVVFGVVHFPTQRELRPWTGFAIGVGVGFGALAAWSQCLAAPVLAHLLINWLNLARLDKIQLDSEPAPAPGD